MKVNRTRLHNLISHSFTADHLVIVAIILFSAWLMWGTFRADSTGYLIDSKLWSDFGAHIPLIRSFSMGSNWPPEYPTFPGEPIRYHYLFYLLVGLMERVGVPIPLALNGLSALGFSLLLWLVYDIVHRLTNSTSSGLLAVFLLIFNGSLSFVDYFAAQGLTWKAIAAIPTQTHFASFGPWGDTLVSAFWNLNIYTNQRHLALSFAVGLFVLRPFVLSRGATYRFRTYTYLGACISMIVLAWMHRAVFVMVLLVSAGYMLVSFRNRALATYFGALLLSGIPGLVYLAFGSDTSIVYEPGFLSAGNVLEWFVYWFYNMGIYAVLLPVLLAWDAKQRLWILWPFVSLFILANTFRLSTDMINNHKLINFFWIGVVIYTVLFMSRLRGPRPLRIGVIGGLVVLASFGGIVDFFPILNDHAIHLSSVRNDPVATWIADHTPPDSVFLTTRYLYHPALLAGRYTYLDYGYFNWSLGYDDRARRATLPALFASNGDVCERLTQAGIDFVSVSSNSELDYIDVSSSFIVTTFEPVFEQPGAYTLYAVAENCELS